MVGLQLSCISVFWELLDRRGLFSLGEGDLNSGGLRSLRDELLLNCMIVVMDDLDLHLELIDFSLHELLCDLGQEFKVELDKSTLHDLLAELDGLLLALFHNLPKLV